MLFLYINSAQAVPPPQKARGITFIITVFVAAIIAVMLGANRTVLQNNFTGHEWLPFLFIGTLGLVPWVFAIAALITVNRKITTKNKYLLYLTYGYIAVWSWGLIAHFLGSFIHATLGDRIPHIIGVTNNYISLLLTAFLYAKSYRPNQAENTQQQSPTSPATPPPVKDSREDTEALELINSALTHDKIYLDSRINLVRFAEHTKLKTKTVSRLIKQYHHCSFIELINQERLKEAERLLTHTHDLTAQRVGQVSGFASSSSFYRLFKNAYGVSPAHYRKNKANHSETKI